TVLVELIPSPVSFIISSSYRFTLRLTNPGTLSSLFEIGRTSPHSGTFPGLPHSPLLSDLSRNSVSRSALAKWGYIAWPAAELMCSSSLELGYPHHAPYPTLALNSIYPEAFPCLAGQAFRSQRSLLSLSESQGVLPSSLVLPLHVCSLFCRYGRLSLSQCRNS